MKYVLSILAFLAGFMPAVALAASPQHLHGDIVLQVEQNGEAWYVHPETGRAHFLGRPVDALNLMREIGLGVSNEDLNKLPGEGNEDGEQIDEEFTASLSGKILLQVEEKGQAWYIWPENNQRYYLGSPQDALRVLRERGTGISESTFTRMDLADDYARSKERFALAKLAMQQPEDADVQQAIADGMMEKIETDDMVAYRVELTSPLSTEEHGYLGAGTYYQTPDGFMNEEAYSNSDFMRQLEGDQMAQQIVEEMLGLQGALEQYKAKSKGYYPLSNDGPTRIGIEGRDLVTYPDAFYGTADDELVYDRLELPLADQDEYAYYYDSPEGLSYSVTFTLPGSYGGFEPGDYELSPDGLSKAE